MQKGKIIQFLDQPSSTFGKVVILALILLVYISIAQLVVEIRYPEFVSSNPTVFLFIKYLILCIFTAELVLRIVCDPNRLKYLISFYGIIDLIAVIPGLLGIFLPFSGESAWIRAFRLLRFIRILKVLRLGKSQSGFTQALTPYFATAIGFKGVIVALEGQHWWPEINNLNVVIGVVGFALAVLLGTKLQVTNSRLYSIEDAVCRIVGGMRDMQGNKNIASHIIHWSKELEAALLHADKGRSDVIKQMRLKTDQLEQQLEAEGIGGPNTAGFHRDVAYLLHRSLAHTPLAYENFLRNIVFSYTAVVIIAVPGLTGFLSTFLLIYVLGGLFLLIADMDSPLDFGPNSLIFVKLDPLKQFNEKN